jgi:DNA recombination protein RmuC
LGLLEKNQERIERNLREEISRNRDEAIAQARQAREELAGTLTLSFDSLLARISEVSNLQKNQLDIFANQLVTLTASNEERLNRVRDTLETSLRPSRRTRVSMPVGVGRNWVYL